MTQAMVCGEGLGEGERAGAGWKRSVERKGYICNTPNNKDFFKNQ